MHVFFLQKKREVIFRKFLNCAKNTSDNPVLIGKKRKVLTAFGTSDANQDELKTNKQLCDF